MSDVRRHFEDHGPFDDDGSFDDDGPFNDDERPLGGTSNERAPGLER